MKYYQLLWRIILHYYITRWGCLCCPDPIRSIRPTIQNHEIYG